MGSKAKKVEPVEEEYEYYEDETVEETETEVVSEEPKKEDPKAAAALLKEQNEARKLELEDKKLEFEMKKFESNQALESRKLDIEEKRNEAELDIEREKNEIERDKALNEMKASKKEFWLGVGKTVAAIGGVVASTAFGCWSLVSTMKFEETGTVRTSAGKMAQSIASKTMAKLENVKKDI